MKYPHFLRRTFGVFATLVCFGAYAARFRCFQNGGQINYFKGLFLFVALFIFIVALPHQVLANSWKPAYVTPISVGIIRGIIIDTNSKVIYASGGYSNALIYRCVLSTECDESSDWTISYDPPSTDVYKFTIDSTHNVLYASGGDLPSSRSIIYRCDLATSCNEQGDWTTAFSVYGLAMSAIVFDSLHNVLYAGQSGGSAIIFRCDTSTGCTTAANWTTSYSTGEQSIVSMIFDSAHNVLYAGSWPHGKIFRCDTSTGCTTAANWITSIDTPNYIIESFGIDTTHNVLYAGSDQSSLDSTRGRIYRCDMSTNCNEPTDWSTAFIDPGEIRIVSFAFNPIDGMLYAGSNPSGVIYRCDTATGCANQSNWYVNYSSGKNNIESLAVDTTNNIIYAGSSAPYGRFGVEGATIYRYGPDPDLITQNLTGSGVFITGSTLTFSGNVTNSGPGDAPASTARFCIDNASCLTTSTGQIAAPAVGALLSGATSPVLSANWVATAGMHTLYFCADVGATVVESNEASNCTNSGVFTVANPLITSLSASPNPVQAGNTTTITLNSTNTSSCSLTILYPSPGGTSVSGSTGAPNVSLTYTTGVLDYPTVSFGVSGVCQNSAGVSSGFTSFTVNVNYTSIFITKAGAGTGVVTSSPVGPGGQSVNCGATCTSFVYRNGTVNLTATPSVGSIFAGWSGDADCADGSIVANANKNCTATFALATYTITASAGANGTISPTGAVTVTQGTNKTFTITPNAGYRILSVTVDGVNQGAISSYTFTNLQGSHTISAAFALNTGCINGTDASGNPLTLLSVDRTAAELNGKYRVTKFGGNYCFGNTSSSRYLIPLNTLAEFLSFWNNIGAGSNLPGLYRIP